MEELLLKKKEEAFVKSIKLELYFDGELVTTTDAKSVNGIVKAIEMWKRLYALKRWADRCEINIKFYTQKAA